MLQLERATDWPAPPPPADKPDKVYEEPVKDWPQPPAPTPDPSEKPKKN